MKRAITLALLLFFSTHCFADDSILPYDEWDKKHYDESAVVLEFSLTTTVNKDLSYSDRVHIVKRIQNEAGMSEGELSFSYNPKRDKIRFIKARITSPDGKRQRYKMIQDVNPVKEGYYSDLRKKIVTMPSVIPGSVIDFEYEIFHKQGPLKGHFFTGIALNSTTPIKHSFVKLTVPKSLKLYFKKINTKYEPVTTSSDKTATYLWESKGDDDYDQKWAQEDITPPSIDVQPYVSISTIRDWSTFADIYAAIYLKAAGINPQIKEAAQNIIQGNNTDTEKIEAIRKYLFDNFRYVAVNLNEHDFVPHPAEEVFQNRFGDCKDQSILFISMLKDAGIKAYPVLVRQEGDGDFKKLLPATESFEHVMVGIPMEEKIIFVDPLINGYRIDETPYSLEGSYVLVLDGKGGKAMQIPYMPLEHKTQRSKLQVTLESDGSANVKLEITPNLSNAVDLREKFKVATEQDKQKILEILENVTRGGKVISHSIVGLENAYGPLTVKIESSAPEYLKLMGPYMFWAGDNTDLLGSFSQKTRKYPIWFNNEALDEDITEVRIPDGFRFEYIPKNVNLKSDWMDLDIFYMKKGKIIEQTQRIHYKRTLIPPSKYQEFRDYLLKCEQALAEVIVLRKDKVE